MSNKFKPTLSEQTAKELEIFLLERELNREVTEQDLLNNPLVQVQLDVIAHLEELRDEMNKKIDLMKMRTKNIY